MDTLNHLNLNKMNSPLYHIQRERLRYIFIKASLLELFGLESLTMEPVGPPPKFPEDFDNLEKEFVI